MPASYQNLKKPRKLGRFCNSPPTGSSCVSIDVVNAKTGDVNAGPFNILGYGAVLDYADGKDEPLSYKLDSRLLSVCGCPEDRNCAEYFYEWNGPGFRLVQKIRPASSALGSNSR
jgi:hypothetical protein